MALPSHRKVITAVLAASVLVTGLSVAAPARASDEDVGRALAALLGLAVVGAIIADNNDSDKKSYSSQNLKPRPLPKRVSRRTLPAQCERRFRTDRGPWRIFTQRCMRQNYANIAELPRVCERVIRTDRGRRVGWGARCLRERGFRVSRR